jgi:hypothetical protein
VSKKPKLPRRRCPAAAALALPLYRRRSQTPKTVYKRKTKHKQEYSTCSPGGSGSISNARAFTLKPNEDIPMDCKLELAEAPVKAVKITLTVEEAAILRELVGSVVGGSKGVVRSFTDKLWGVLTDIERDYDPTPFTVDYFTGEVTVRREVS